MIFEQIHLVLFVFVALELVAAARRFRFHKLTEMEETIQETVQAVEATYLKQEFSEKFNVILW